jgi:hypothetical protein
MNCKQYGRLVGDSNNARVVRDIDSMWRVRESGVGNGLDQSCVVSLELDGERYDAERDDPQRPKPGVEHRTSWL